MRKKLPDPSELCQSQAPGDNPCLNRNVSVAVTWGQPSTLFSNASPCLTVYPRDVEGEGTCSGYGDIPELSGELEPSLNGTVYFERCFVEYGKTPETKFMPPMIGNDRTSYTVFLPLYDLLCKRLVFELAYINNVFPTETARLVEPDFASQLADQKAPSPPCWRKPPEDGCTTFRNSDDNGKQVTLCVYSNLDDPFKPSGGIYLSNIVAPSLLPAKCHFLGLCRNLETINEYSASSAFLEGSFEALQETLGNLYNLNRYPNPTTDSRPAFVGSYPFLSRTGAWS